MGSITKPDKSKAPITAYAKSENSKQPVGQTTSASLQDSKSVAVARGTKLKVKDNDGSGMETDQAEQLDTF